MKKLSLIAILLIVAMIGVVAAIVTETYIFPQTAKEATISLEVYIGDTPLTTLDWGYLARNSWYDLPLNVKSTSTMNATVTISVNGMPADWTETWTLQGYKIMPGTWLNGTLTLATSDWMTFPSLTGWELVVTGTEV